MSLALLSSPRYLLYPILSFAFVGIEFVGSTDRSTETQFPGWKIGGGATAHSNGLYMELFPFDPLLAFKWLIPRGKQEWLFAFTSTLKGKGTWLTKEVRPSLPPTDNSWLRVYFPFLHLSQSEQLYSPFIFKCPLCHSQQISVPPFSLISPFWFRMLQPIASPFCLPPFFCILFPWIYNRNPILCFCLFFLMGVGYFIRMIISWLLML